MEILKVFRTGDQVVFPHRGQPVIGVVQYLVGAAAVVDTDEGTRYPMIEDMDMVACADAVVGEDVRMRVQGAPGLFDEVSQAD